MKNFKSFLVFPALSAFLLVSSCVKEKDTNDMIVEKKGLELSPGQEVPPTASKASGTMNVSYNKTSHMLNFDITWSNLTGNPTGSHIHGTAKRGVNAPIKYDFFSSIPKVTSGSYSSSFMVDGVAVKEDSLLMGYYYLNIHTPTYPGGEIRGQIEF